MRFLFYMIEIRSINVTSTTLIKNRHIIMFNKILIRNKRFNQIFYYSILENKQWLCTIKLDGNLPCNVICLCGKLEKCCNMTINYVNITKILFDINNIFLQNFKYSMLTFWSGRVCPVNFSINSRSYITIN